MEDMQGSMPGFHGGDGKTACGKNGRRVAGKAAALRGWRNTGRGQKTHAEKRTAGRGEYQRKTRQRGRAGFAAPDSASETTRAFPSARRAARAKARGKTPCGMGGAGRARHKAPPPPRFRRQKHRVRRRSGRAPWMEKRRPRAENARGKAHGGAWGQRRGKTGADQEKRGLRLTLPCSGGDPGAPFFPMNG